MATVVPPTSPTKTDGPEGGYAMFCPSGREIPQNTPGVGIDPIRHNSIRNARLHRYDTSCKQKSRRLQRPACRRGRSGNSDLDRLHGGLEVRGP